MVDIYEHSSDLYDALNKKPDKKKIKEFKKFYGFDNGKSLGRIENKYKEKIKGLSKLLNLSLEEAEIFYKGGLKELLSKEA